MIQSKPSKNLRETPLAKQRFTKTSDEVTAFTEKPRAEADLTPVKLDAHELFALFTANIIIEKTTFTR